MKNCFDVAVDMMLVSKADTSFDDWPISSSHLPRRAGRKRRIEALELAGSARNPKSVSLECALCEKAASLDL